MAGLVSLSTLETRTRRLADLENATFRFPQPEVWDYINQAIRKVYAEVMTTGDLPYYLKDYSFTTYSQTTVYPLPPDFLRMVSVLFATSTSGPWRELDKYSESERAMLLNAGYTGAVWPSKWGITGGTGAFTQGTIPTAYSIEILPPPTGGATIKLRYTPSAPQLLQASDTLDGILGFEDAVCTWAAVLMRRKDDLDTADLERDFERHLNYIHMIAKRRDGSRPPKVSIVRSRSANWRGGGRGGYGYGW